MTDNALLPSAAATAQPGYGGFRLGDMHLALPLTALREVVPLQHLLPLPCRLDSVIGAIDLRGTLVPVLDLWRALGRTASDAQAMPEPCVLIAVCEGRLIGLLAAAVTGIFEAPLKGATAQPAAAVDAPDGAALPSLFGGSLQREGEANPLSLIRPEVLAHWPGLPLIEDPEPQRCFRAESPGEGDPQAGEAMAVAVDEPVVLMRCGGLVFGLAALDVFATLPDVRLEPSALARGYCRGVVRHAGTEVPALDLAELCGLQPQAAAQLREGVLLRVGDGYLALLIEKVLNVVGLQPTDGLPLPRLAMPHTAWCKSLLPARLVQDGAGGAGDPGYLLDGERLRADPNLLGLARLRAGEAQQGHQGGTAHGASAPGTVAASGERERLITFDVGVEMGARLSQVVRVLSFAPQPALGGLPGHVMGVAIDQDRSIPVLDLPKLLGVTRASTEDNHDTAPLNVLVVQSGDDLVGYAVPRLVSIEEAAWVIDRPGNAVTASRQLALVGQGDDERTVRVLDLMALS